MICFDYSDLCLYPQAEGSLQKHLDIHRHSSRLEYKETKYPNQVYSIQSAPTLHIEELESLEVIQQKASKVSWAKSFQYSFAELILIRKKI